jgi:hypothetical protein
MVRVARRRRGQFVLGALWVSPHPEFGTSKVSNEDLKNKLLAMLFCTA